MGLSNGRMTSFSGEMTSYSGQSDKETWTPPVLEMMPINAALGNVAGPKCDKHGSLSTGGPCQS